MSEDITPFNDIRLSAALAVGWGLLAGYFQLWNDQRGELQNSLVLQRRLLEQALQDALTGLPNRRAGAQFLNDSIQRHAGVGVALIDIDHFKQINDRYGHDFGDDVLIAIGQQLKESTASDSRVSRWGGEEFLAVLPGYSHTATLEWSEQLRQSIEALMPYGLKVTISVGVARTEVINDQTVLRRADQALYRAKKGGRNQVFPQSVS